MHQPDDQALLDRHERRHRGEIHACLGIIALLLAGLAGSWPGLVATAAIGATALGLLGAQHVISRRMGDIGPWGRSSQGQ